MLLSRPSGSPARETPGRERTQALRETGVALAIDDFGTGYSSLSRLKRFHVDYLKIDREFVAGLGTDPDDEKIVSAVVGLGRSLGIRLIAEGIETADQLAALVALGCDVGQGYLLAKPLPLDEATAFVLRSRPLELPAG